MKVLILSKQKFQDKVIPNINNFKDTFFISILDPDCPEKLYPDNNNYKSWWFWDIEQDYISEKESYTAVTQEQAKEIYDFIKQHTNKKQCIVHCSAGISRSGAVGSFVHEYFGGRYKELLKEFPHIFPNGRLVRLLRMYERIDGVEEGIIKF